MDLKTLIETRKQSKLPYKPIGRMLDDLRRLDEQRAKNLPKLVEKISQIEAGMAQADPTEENRDPVADWLPAYKEEISALQIAASKDFAGDLNAALAAQGFRLEGQLPLLRSGLFTLVVQKESGQCEIWYGPRVTRLAVTSLDAQTVFERMRSLRKGLGAPVKLDDLAEMVMQAARHLRLDRPGGLLHLPLLVPYVELLIKTGWRTTTREIGENWNYRVCDLSFDLFQLNSMAVPYRLRVATQQQTQSPRDFLWIPTREDVDSGAAHSTIELKESAP